MIARIRRTVVPVAIATLLGVSAVVGAGVEEADRAFAEGDHDRALALYEEILTDTPDDVHALFRAGLLLSWSRRYDAAIDRYDRLLAAEPSHPRAALERAKVLSWDRRFDEAAAAFRAILAERPDLREARLGLARTTSWSGRQRAARRAYLRLLDDDPGDVEAMVGVAQTHAWSGDPFRARLWYRRALDADPDRKEAILGLAYLDLWTPDRVEADRRIAALRDAHPDDPEVADLVEARDRAERWWSAVAWDRIDDTDGNLLDIGRLQAGVALGPRLDLDLGLDRYDMSDPTGDGTIDSLHATLGWRVAAEHRLTVRAGVDRLEDTAGERTDETIGGVSWRYLSRRRPLRVDASYDRDPLRYSPTILDAGVVLDRVRLRATYEPTARWRVAGTVQRWDASDDNARDAVTAEAWYAWPSEPVTIETGYLLDLADWDLDLDNGYFDPQDFVAHLLRVRLRGPLPVRDATWNVDLTGGVQSFTLGGVDVDHDTVVGVEGRVLVPFATRFVLDLHAGWSDYAAQSTSGFESTRFGFRLRWTW